MSWLNYHHFLYFWTVAKEGSIAKAGEKLLLAQPTISGQIHQLEESLGVKLFRRRGRGLVLTEAGQVAFRYAEEIFSLGQEFLDALKGEVTGRALRLVVGVAEALTPSLVRRFLEPAFALGSDIQIVCRADRTLEEFLAELALHRIDVVISDRPAAPSVAVRAFSNLLGECDTTFFAAPTLARKLRGKFPASLEGAPLLLPGETSSLRRSLETWFERNALKPKVVAECDDSALIKDLGSVGMGVFGAPSVVEAEIIKQHGVAIVGRSSEVRQQFYAISVERKIRHPAVVAVCEAARSTIFKSSAKPARKRRRA